MISDKSPDHYLLRFVLLTAALLLLLSSLPWSRLTGNRIKDFDLFADLRPPVATATEKVDPVLSAPADESSPATASGDSTAITTDESPTEQPEAAVVREPMIQVEPNTIENYSGVAPLSHFREALAQSGTRPVHIAVIGDSYIEGDIFCQDLRDMLQRRYGGGGVGFMAMHSDFPGFRQSVKQSDSGWKLHDIRTMKQRDSIRVLPGSYAVAQGAATATFRGSGKFGGTAGWNRSSFAFVAPAAGTVSVTDDSGVTVSHNIAPSGDVQTIVLDGHTTAITVDTDIPGLTALGAYLDNDTGVTLDCMSVRGNSGHYLRSLNGDMCRQTLPRKEYDLIIIEYGMNVVNDQETDYTGYARTMARGVEHLRGIYPTADIIILGVGDRGVKDGAGVVSLSTLPAMTSAQRTLARNTSVLFYDTRLAMGGNGSIVDWRSNQLVNADYIHLNHAGGRKLATLFFDALSNAIDR